MSADITWQNGWISREARWKNLGCNGATIWLTGLPASGKTTIAAALEKELNQRGLYAYRLDGDNIRHGLNRDLGFSREDREENIRRIGEVASLFADSGGIAITAFISPYLSDREKIRKLHQKARLLFLEVFVDAPLQICEQRDPKGLYRKARGGEIKGFTGIDDPYEAPLHPDLVLKTAEKSIEECLQSCLKLLMDKAVLDQAPYLRSRPACANNSGITSVE